MKFLELKFTEKDKKFVQDLIDCTSCDKEQAKLWCYQVKKNMYTSFAQLCDKYRQIRNFWGNDFNFTSMYVRPEGDRNWRIKYDPSKIFIHDGLYMLFVIAIIDDFNKGIYHSFQENLQGDCPVRSFLDIDGNVELKQEYIDLVIKTFQSEFAERHKNVTETMLNNYYQLENASAPQRKFHIHFPKLITTKRVLIDIVEKVREKIPPLADFIDVGYSGCRMVYNVKVQEGEQNPDNVYYVQGSDIYEMILMFFRVRVRPFSIWEEPLELEDQYQQQYLKKVFNYEPIDDPVLNLMLKVTEKYPDFEPIVEDNMIRLRRLRPSFCDVCKVEHQKDNMYLYYGYGKVWLGCRRQQYYKKKPVAVEDIKSNFSPEVKKALSTLRCRS